MEMYFLLFHHNDSAFVKKYLLKLLLIVLVFFLRVSLRHLKNRDERSSLPPFSGYKFQYCNTVQWLQFKLQIMFYGK